MQTVTTILTDAGPIAPSGPSDNSQQGTGENQFGDVLNQELNSQQQPSKAGGTSQSKATNSETQSEPSEETAMRDAKEPSSGQASKKSTSEKTEELSTDVSADSKAAHETSAVDKATQLALLRRGANANSQDGNTAQHEHPTAEKGDVIAEAGTEKEAAAAAAKRNNGQQAEDNAAFLGMLKQSKETKTTVQQNVDDSAGGIDQRAGQTTIKQDAQILQNGKASFVEQQAQKITSYDKGKGDNIMPVISPENDGKAEKQVLDFTVPNKIKQAMDAANKKAIDGVAVENKVMDSDGEGEKIANLSDRVFTQAELKSQQPAGSQVEKPISIIERGIGSNKDGASAIAQELSQEEVIDPSLLEPVDEISPIKGDDDISPIKNEHGVTSELFAQKATSKEPADTQRIVEQAQVDVQQAALKTSSQQADEAKGMETAAADALVEKAVDNKGENTKGLETTEAALKAQNASAENMSQQQGDSQGKHSQQNQQQSEFADLLSRSESTVTPTEQPRQTGQDSSIAMASQPSSNVKVAATQNINTLNQPKLSAEIDAQINETIHTSKANFAVAAHERVMLMSNNGVNFADIRLDPADLGKMQIKMTQEGDQVNVSFVVQQPHAKEALESALPKLKELLAEQGIELGEGAISQESPKRDMDKDGEPGSGRGQFAGQDDAEGDEPALEEMAASHIRVANGALGGIDYFA